jgi:hypothetical protein
LLFIVSLLAQCDRLLDVSHLHLQPAASGGDRQVLIAQPPDQVEGLLRRPLEREPCGVLRHRVLHRRPHLRRQPEESIRGRQPFDALVRPLEVVAIDEEPQPTVTVRKIRKHRPRQKFLPQRLPEALDLPQRLRVLRTALDVLDALPSQLLRERRLSAPRHVLPPLVRQNLPRRPVLRDASVQRLHHQLRPLPVRQRVRHDEARVVVHERRQVEPLVPPQKKREDVRLPQLVRHRPLETPRRVLPRRLLSRPIRQQPLFVQDPSHHRLRHPQRLEALQHVADPSRPVLRVLPPKLGYRLALRRRRCRRFRFRPHHPRRQAVDATNFVSLDPVVQRRLVDAEDPADLRRRRLALQRLPHQPHPKLHRVHHVPPIADHCLA